MIRVTNKIKRQEYMLVVGPQSKSCLYVNVMSNRWAYVNLTWFAI